jgi:DNA-binding response OmpR family regulator
LKLSTYSEPSQNTRGKILIVEDQLNIRVGLRDLLHKDGYSVRGAASGEAALALLEEEPCEVALVDIRMSGISGIELMHIIRTSWPFISVIMITGHGSLQSAIAAVRAGASDYLLKPAKPTEIREAVSRALDTSRRLQEQHQLLKLLHGSVKRLELLSRKETGEPSHPNSTKHDDLLLVGDVSIDLGAHEVRRGEESITLSPTEFKLLVALASHPGVVRDYVSLANEVLGYQVATHEARELIKRHIFSLRHKLEPNPSSPRYIINVRGIGYRMDT